MYINFIFNSTLFLLFTFLNFNNKILITLFGIIICINTYNNYKMNFKFNQINDQINIICNNINRINNNVNKLTTKKSNKLKKKIY